MEISLEHYNKMAERLTELEYLLAEQRWIPCSDKLPEYGRTVLWCNEHGSVFTSAITYMKDNAFTVGQHSGVIAWMPLPEPYNGR